MNTKLNLASKPFSNRALPWALIMSITFVSLIGLIFIVRATSRANAQANAVQMEINGLKEQEQAIRVRAAEVQNTLTAEQRQTLFAAHELVDRKRFSWSRLFSDLEAALPGTVRVSRISVRDVAARGEQMVAELDLVVVCKTPSTVTEMIGGMDRAGIFQAQLLSQNLKKGRGESGTEYELDVIYRPRAGSPSSEDQASNLASVGTKIDQVSGEPR